jgi:hypothetical protein
MGKFNCCCEPEFDECCAEEDAAVPSVSVGNYTANGVSGSGCCHTFDFSPNSLDSDLHCCETLSVNSIEYLCTHEDYLLSYTPTYPGDGCTPPQDKCCATSLKVAEFQQQAKLTQTNKFAVDFYPVSLSVIVGKEYTVCSEPEIETPVCRWFVRALMRYRYAASVNTQKFGEQSFANTYIHPCFQVAPGYPDDSSSSLLCDNDEVCLSDPELESPCTDRDIACFSAEGEFCVQRIKFFTDRPEGIIELTSLDVLDPCEETTCGAKCVDWEQETCVASPAFINPPHWCNDPPTVSRVSTTYTPSVSTCAAPYNVDTFTCTIGLQFCNPLPSCASQTSYTVVCDSIEVPDWDIVPQQCRFDSSLPNFAYEPCTCYNSDLTPPWYIGVAQGALCTGDCYYRVLCDEGDVVLICLFDHPSIGAWGKNEITIDVVCGSFEQQQCCFTPAGLTINLVWP